MVWKEMAAGGSIACQRHITISLVRSVDESENRLFCFDKSNVDRELAVFLNKLLCAVQRIDEKEIFLDIGNVACRQTLFSDDRDFGKKL